MDNNETLEIATTMKDLLALEAMFESTGWKVYQRVLADVEASVVEGAKSAVGLQSMGGYQAQMNLMDELKAHEGEVRDELERKRTQDVV